MRDSNPEVIKGNQRQSKAIKRQSEELVGHFMRNVIRDALSDAIREGIRRPSEGHQWSSRTQTRDPQVSSKLGRSGEIKGDPGTSREI